MTKKTYIWLWSAFLACLILLPYLQMHSHDFIIWDDSFYIYDNPMVTQGLNLLGVGWAFITFATANWHPLTWISHMLDSSIFGPTPFAAHLMNSLWYAGCILLSFFLFLQLGASFPAAFLMAAFFGLHPLHVESVAWASERKDLLCAFFFLSAMLAYLHYARKRILSLYLLTTGFFILALLSKPMAVTWPCVVLLLDYWPLDRWKNDAKRVVLEKIPWVVLASLSSIITVIAQHQRDAVKSLVEFSLTDRLANAAISYLIYVRQTVWPSGLTVFYPYPLHIHLGDAFLACFFLIIVTIVVVRQKQQYPYLLWGWLFYLGVLFPVIGIVQVGSQAHADRYMFLPQLGLILAVGLFLDKTVVKMKLRRGLAVLMMIIAAVLMIITFRQVSYWKNSKSLFYRNLEVAGENELAHFNLGSAYLENNELDMAVIHLTATAQMNPQDATTFNNLGIAYARKKIDALAEACFHRAILLDPRTVQPYVNLAVLKTNQGRFEEALDHINTAVQLAPDYKEARDIRNALEKAVLRHKNNADGQ